MRCPPPIVAARASKRAGRLVDGCHRLAGRRLQQQQQHSYHKQKQQHHHHHYQHRPPCSRRVRLRARSAERLSRSRVGEKEDLLPPAWTASPGPGADMPPLEPMIADGSRQSSAEASGNPVVPIEIPGFGPHTNPSSLIIVVVAAAAAVVVVVDAGAAATGGATNCITSPAQGPFGRPISSRLGSGLLKT